VLSIPASRQFSAGTRVALALSVSVLLGVVLLTAVSYIIYRGESYGSLDGTLALEADAYHAAMQALVSEDSYELAEASERYLRADFDEPRAIMAVRIAPDVQNADGQDIASPHSPVSQQLLDDPANQENLNAVSTHRDLEWLSLGGVQYRVATIPVRSPEGDVLAVFQAALPSSTVSRMISESGQALVLAAIAVILAGGLLSRWVARATLRPLHDAAVVAGTVSDSSLSQRIQYNGPKDDVGSLVASLNGMLDRLEAAFAEQRRFVADASHEMRTPITIVRGHLDVMRAEGGLNPDQEGTLDLVAEELQRTSTLVSDLLSLARLEGGPPPPFAVIDLGQVVEEAVVRAQALGERRFSFQHGGQLPVRGNQDLLLQAILNLLTNAVRYTRPGGRIEVSSYADDGIAAVEVADDGPGIPEEDLERIFDRFYRSQRRPRGLEGGGSGLGLAIARRLVQLHGGELRAYNRPGGGALFILELPRVASSLDDSNATLTAV
jgi:signal transduction histidine kinase